MKRSKLLCIVCLCVLVAVVASACNLIVTPDDALPKLDVPQVTIAEDGVASWGAVEHATGYRYMIGDAVKVTAQTQVTLTDGQSIRVQALGDGETYADSNYSTEQTYTAGQEPQQVVIDLFAINDLHGKFMDTDTQPGVDELTTYIEQLYADDTAQEIWLSSGDMWQGTVESSTNRGQLMTDWMNHTGFASMTLGNHEYDWGNDGLQTIADMAEFPLLAINVRVDGELPAYCQPSTVVEKGGVKVGIIGAIGNCLSSISGEYQQGLEFVVGDGLTQLVKDEATRLRTQEDCDLVVYSLHDGYERSTHRETAVNGPLMAEDYVYYDTALSNGYVDVVFEGHTHQSYILKDEYGVYHLQGGGENRAISRAHVVIDTATGKHTVSASIVENDVYAATTIQASEVPQQIFDRYFADGNPYTTVIGYNETTRDGYEICDTVAELYMLDGKLRWGDTYDIVLAGGYLKARNPYRIAYGDVTYAQIFSVLPFDNSLVLGSISGDKLLSQFINSTNSAYHCAYDQSVVSTIAASETYYIVVDTYTSTYAPNGITEVARVQGLYARDLLRDYIALGGWGGTVQPQQLEQPWVTVDPTGVASWEPIEHAVEYRYYLNGSDTALCTTDTQVQLEDGQYMYVVAVGDGVNYRDSEPSYTVDYVKYNPEPLPAPEVTVDYRGLATWTANDAAAGYRYTINGTVAQTTGTSVQLTDGQTLTVVALGHEGYSLDSEESNSVTYREPIVLDYMQAFAVGNALPDTNPSENWYIVTAPILQVTEAEYGNMILGDAEHSIYVYRLRNADDTVDYCDMTDKPQVGDRVSIVGKLRAFINSMGYDIVSLEPPRLLDSVVPVPKQTLSVPSVTVDGNGMASWAAVPNATEYRYRIGDAQPVTTSLTQVQLTAGQSICVQAVGDGALYADSDYSQVVTYAGTHTHTDSDDNGACDGCGQSVLVVIDIFAINDLHGKFMDTDAQPGVDELTTYIKQLYADDAAQEIWLSSGDMWQGTVESSTNRGQLMTEWMNHTGFVSMTLGNHEYDWGNDGLQTIADMAEFPLLAINVRVDGALPAYCQPSVVVEKGGVKVGIIGAIGNCLSSISGEYQKGLSFVVGDQLTQLVKDEATRLRNQEGCDLVVYSLHDGYEQSSSGITSVTGPLTAENYTYYDTALSNGYIDVVFEGHTHQSYILQDEYGVYHLQAGGENRAIGKAGISYNIVTGSFDVAAQTIGNSVYGDMSLQDDPIVRQLFDKYFADGDPYATVVGVAAESKRDTDICDTVAQLYRQKGVELWGDRYDIVLGGGFLKTRSPYNIAAGNVTYSQIFSVLPFDNSLVLGSISGSKLLSQFINSTNATYHCDYDASLAETIDETATYYIVVDTYTSTYSRNGITEVARVQGLYARDLLRDYIAAGGWDDQQQQQPEPTVTTIAEVLAIGEALADNATTEEWYTVTATVLDVKSTTYGNMNINDGTDTVYIYGLYSSDGTVRYDAMTTKPQVGDVITVRARIKKYVSSSGTVTIELLNARLQSIA